MTVVRAAAVQLIPVLYSRPEVLSLRIDQTPRAPVYKESHDHQPTANAVDIDHASL